MAEAFRDVFSHLGPPDLHFPNLEHWTVTQGYTLGLPNLTSTDLETLTFQSDVYQLLNDATLPDNHLPEPVSQQGDDLDLIGSGSSHSPHQVCTHYPALMVIDPFLGKYRSTS